MDPTLRPVLRSACCLSRSSSWRAARVPTSIRGRRIDWGVVYCGCTALYWPQTWSTTSTWKRVKQCGRSPTGAGCKTEAPSCSVRRGGALLRRGACLPGRSTSCLLLTDARLGGGRGCSLAKSALCPPPPLPYQPLRATPAGGRWPLLPKWLRSEMPSLYIPTSPNGHKIWLRNEHANNTVPVRWTPSAMGVEKGSGATWVRRRASGSMKWMDAAGHHSHGIET